MKHVQRIFYMIFLFLSLHVSLAGQENKKEKKQKKHNFTFLPLPVIAANPTSGWMFGLAPGASWFLGDTANTSLSSALGTFIYTTNKQWILTLKATTFFSGDKYNLMSDIRYFITSQPTYGLGTGPQSSKLVSTSPTQKVSDNPYVPISTAQMMAFDYVRFHQTLLKKHQDTRFFYGIGYHLDYHYKIKDNLLDLSDTATTITSHYAYSVSKGFDPTKYTLSGLSVNVLYDSRDNAVNPYAGRYAFANIRVCPTFLGSSENSTILWLEYRDYIHLSKNRPRHLIGFWTYASFQTSGDLPYLDLPAVGWDQFGRSGRAYTQGRFRGEDLIYGEVEYRFPLQKKGKERLGGVVFANAITASNRSAELKLFNYLDPACGLGLRVMINKSSRANLTLDYAWGYYGSQGFYLGLNEAF